VFEDLGWPCDLGHAVALTKSFVSSRLAGWDVVAREMTLSEAQIAHLWLPGRPPHAYDRVHEANQRVFDAYDAQHAARRAAHAPEIRNPRRLNDEGVR
jgi:hypothetical protein